jgi:hypothetical protein
MTELRVVDIKGKKHTYTPFPAEFVRIIEKTATLSVIHDDYTGEDVYVNMSKKEIMNRITGA